MATMRTHGAGVSDEAKGVGVPMLPVRWYGDPERPVAESLVHSIDEVARWLEGNLTIALHGPSGILHGSDVHNVVQMARLWLAEHPEGA